jgi:hypothetical protein
MKMRKMVYLRRVSNSENSGLGQWFPSAEGGSCRGAGDAVFGGLKSVPFSTGGQHTA